MTIAIKPWSTLTGTWHADVAHSQVGFSIQYLGGTFRATFAPFEARLEVDEDGNARLTGSARADAVHVHDEMMHAHLLSPEFFDVERAPELRFESTAFHREGHDVTVPGELTVRGVTKPVELRGMIGEPVVDPYGRDRASLTLATTVDRTAFGLNWNAELPNGEPALPNDVTLTAELYLIRTQR